MARSSSTFMTGDGVLMVLLALSLSALALLGFILFRPGLPSPEPRAATPQAYTLSVSSDQSYIRLEGPIELGVTAALSKLLDDHTAVRRLELQSAGGRVPEARGLIRLVTERQLATMAQGDCLSACTLVFMAGSGRHMDDGARLGFHSYALPMPVVSALVDVSAEQARDMEWFRDQGVTEAFIARIDATPPDGMWFPSRASLLEAGVLTDPSPNAENAVP